MLCRGDNDPPRLIVGQPQITQRITERPDHDLLVALMHHPLAALMEFDEANAESHLRRDYDILLRGHLHRHDSVRREANNGTYVEVAAGALYERHEAPNRFSLIDIQDDLRQIEIRPFTWSDNRWLLDRNCYPESSDGVGRIALRKPGTSAASTPRPSRGLGLDERGNQPEPDFTTGDGSADQRGRTIDLLATFPRFRDEARPQTSRFGNNSRRRPSLRPKRNES